MQATAAAEPAPASTGIEGARWHHVHINSVDPAASIAYYAKHFDAKPARFADMMDALWVQKSWLLFNKVREPAPIKLNTGIWHIGWGAPAPKEEYVRQKALGATFFQPLTDISASLSSFRPDQFYFLYLASPDRTLIELNTARTDDFGHIHMFSADPVAAGDFYIRYFGATGRALSTPERPARTSRMSLTGFQVGPSSSIRFENVNMIIYPVEYAKKAYAEDWRGIDEIQPTRGTVNDHIAFQVADLDDALAALRADGVTITQEPAEVPGKFRYAFIEGPDRVGIELIEDDTDHPPEE